MSYKKLPTLSESRVVALKELADTVHLKTSVGSRVRMGRNKEKRLSRYLYSKWFNWSRKERQIYREAVGESRAKEAVQCWFLRIPEKDGFLDVMDTWVYQGGRAAVIATYAVGGDQTIWIGDEEILVKKGEGIAFRLSELHEIRESEEGQLWACMMTQMSPEGIANA